MFFGCNETHAGMFEKHGSETSSLLDQGNIIGNPAFQSAEIWEYLRNMVMKLEVYWIRETL